MIKVDRAGFHFMDHLQVAACMGAAPGAVAGHHRKWCAFVCAHAYIIICNGEASKHSEFLDTKL